jgi:hypothetical protein
MARQRRTPAGAFPRSDKPIARRGGASYVKQLWPPGIAAEAENREGKTTWLKRVG